MDPHARHVANLDRVRLVASFGIVYFHVTGESILFASSLVVFLITTIAFGVRADALPPFRSYAERRLRRLGLPWLFWSAVYLALLAYRQHAAGRTLAEGLRPSMWITGPAPHLWFLPCILVATAAVYPLHRALRRLPRRRAAHVWFAVGAVVALLVRRPVEKRPYPEDVWLLTLPALPLGLAFGRLLGLEPGLRARVAGRVAVAALLIAPWFYVRNAHSLVSRYAFAAAFVAAALVWPGRPDRATTLATRLRYGVYCIHPLIALLVFGPEGAPWARVALVYAASLLAVAPMRATFLRACC